MGDEFPVKVSKAQEGLNLLHSLRRRPLEDGGVRAQCENCVLALNKQIHTNGEWKIEKMLMCRYMSC